MINKYYIKLWLHDFKKKIRPIRGKGNVIKNRAQYFNLKYDIVGNQNTVIIGKSKLHNCTIYIRGNGHQVTIEDGCYLKDTTVYIEDSNCRVKIEKNTTIEGADIDVKEDNNSLYIEEGCMFSKEIYITTSDSHSILNGITRERINPGKGVVIKSRVWLGRGVKVLKGTSIESGTIVAAGSIVTGHLGENSIYAGNPVKLIKEEISWLRERI